ncbi:MAG: peptidase C39 [Oscillospiraceae bacterium]|nr:peptidase C39 [Oscillospiraceae bacterium]
MKIPLLYQRTEYDCGPTTLLNALSVQFEREAISPELIKLITSYATDHYGVGGEHGKGGTSRLAMMFISGWLNEYAEATGFPIATEYVSGGRDNASLGARLRTALTDGAVIVVRVMLGPDEHYILLTALDGERLLAWDPYFTDYAFPDEPDIEKLADKPFLANRRFPLARLLAPGNGVYGMVGGTSREAVIVYNKTTRRERAFEPEYMI